MTHPATTSIVPTSAQQAQRQLYQDLDSNDATRVSAAVTLVRAVLLGQQKGIDAWSALDHLLVARKYAEAEAIGGDMEIIQHVADNAGLLGKLMKLRARALFAENKPREALAAAKAYFNVTPLGQTNDAISLIALCLAAARPEEKGIVRRFKQQQAAGAATQPAATGAALGESILASVAIDPKPYDEAIASVVMDNQKSFTIKGNLLLIAGRAKEAHELFQQAYELADGAELTPITESVARAIRAEAGSVGPANAYILSLREKTAEK